MQQREILSTVQMQETDSRESPVSSFIRDFLKCDFSLPLYESGKRFRWSLQRNKKEDFKTLS